MEGPEVPTEHLHEQIHHHVERSRESWVLGVALSSALLAGLAAVAALMAGHHANEAMLSQIESSDQWSYFEAKSIKQAQLATKTDILSALGKAPANADEAKITQYDAEKEQIQKKAEELEKDAQNHLRTHQALAASVTMFQIAIAVGAIAVLIRRRAFWLGSLLVGAIGMVFFIQSFVFGGQH
jgi:lipopolysaccharide export LptBFGC system permease protein LptF